jgi:sialidase-1
MRLAAFVLLVGVLAALADGAGVREHDLFVSGKEGYHTFRIPSLLVTPKGTILAFCEGRKKGRGDSGNIDVVLKRSLDGGKTWQPMQVIADDEGNTVGNPCPVVDRDNRWTSPGMSRIRSGHGTRPAQAWGCG